MEIIFEILFEGYLHLMLLIVPEDKMPGWGKELCLMIAGVILVACVVAFFAGVCILQYPEGKITGAVMVGVSVAVSVFQIVLGILRYGTKHK